MNRRYTRQIMLPEIGEEGQRRLRQARVLIVGVGGLGAPIALYLAGAGIGTIGLVDDDTVGLSNLQRQILYTEDEIGASKTLCATQRLNRLNHEVDIHAYPCRLTEENAHSIIQAYDIVLDGCDNYPTRYTISDVCARRRIPYIYGSITAFSGQVAILCHPLGKRDYRHLFPEIPENQSQDIQGTIGPTPAIVGSVQANEALKLICGYGRPLIDKLWTIDLLTMESNIISL